MFQEWLASPLGWASLSREARPHRPGSRSMDTTLSTTKLLATTAQELGVTAQVSLEWCLRKDTTWRVLERCRGRTRVIRGETAQVGAARFYQLVQAALKALEFVLVTEPATVTAQSIICKEALKIALHQVGETH